jgi:hypothetical protein
VRGRIAANQNAISCVSRYLLYPARDVLVALGPRLCEDHIGAVLALKNGERALVRR